jgi:hypothetical protein
MDLSWLDDKGHHGHMHVSDEVVDFWRETKRITGWKRMMEIGFMAGHSSAMNLELFNDTYVHSHDIGGYPVTMLNQASHKERYGDRFDFTKVNSLTLNSEDIDSCNYDIMFIDGNHAEAAARSDVNLFLNSNIKYAAIDDMNYGGVSNVVNPLVEDGTLTILKDTLYPGADGKNKRFGVTLVSK